MDNKATETILTPVDNELEKHFKLPEIYIKRSYSEELNSLKTAQEKMEYFSLKNHFF
jgi:hypothetical protein